MKYQDYLDYNVRRTNWARKCAYFFGIVSVVLGSFFPKIASVTNTVIFWVLLLLWLDFRETDKYIQTLAKAADEEAEEVERLKRKA